LLQAFQGREEILAQRISVCPPASVPRHDDEVHGRQWCTTKCITNNPFDPVTGDCPRRSLAADGEAQPRPLTTRFRNKDKVA